MNQSSVSSMFLAVGLFVYWRMGIFIVAMREIVKSFGQWDKIRFFVPNLYCNTIGIHVHLLVVLGLAQIGHPFIPLSSSYVVNVTDLHV